MNKVMKVNILVFLLLGMLCFNSMAMAQEFYSSYFASKPHDSIVKSKISATIYNNNFVKNNEYFGPYTEGITYIGSVFQPEIHWRVAPSFSLSTGWYFRYFYGHAKIETSIPIIRATYNNQKGLMLSIGQIMHGNLQHGFVEPLYNADNYFIKKPEYGVQLTYTNPRLQSEVYMDWEKFILPGDDSQEIITGGALLSYQLIQSNPHSLRFVAQSIIHHKGGQVDNSESLLQTRANAAAGAKYEFNVNTIWLKKVQFSSWYLQALELSQTNTLPYNTGFALLNGVDFSNNYFKLGSFWFHGEYFFAPLGDYTFQSVSQLNDWYTGDNRDIISSKLAFNYPIHEGIKLGFRFESYFDLKRKSNDFSYGLNLLIDRNVFN